MAKMKTPDLTPEFKAKLDSWMIGAQKKVDDGWIEKKYTHAQSPVLRARVGGRFVIVTRHDRSLDGTVADNGSAYAFIDIRGGEIGGLNHAAGSVLKPASFRQPAKIARGNIFADDNGLGCVNDVGINYLK